MDHPETKPKRQTRYTITMPAIANPQSRAFCAAGLRVGLGQLVGDVGQGGQVVGQLGHPGGK